VTSNIEVLKSFPVYPLYLFTRHGEWRAYQPINGSKSVLSKWEAGAVIQSRLLIEGRRCTVAE